MLSEMLSLGHLKVFPGRTGEMPARPRQTGRAFHQTREWSSKVHTAVLSTIKVSEV